MISQPHRFAAAALLIGLSALPTASPRSAHAGGLFWTDRGASQIRRMSFDGSAPAAVGLSGAVTQPGSNIRGIAVDAVNSRFYWADNGSDRILRANLDGSGSAVVATVTGGGSFPADIRIDLSDGSLYWCDRNRDRIMRMPFGGAAVGYITTNEPYFLEIDRDEDRIYWGTFDGGLIMRAALADGGGPQTIVTGNANTRGVAIDLEARMLYWVNRDAASIHRAPLDIFDGPGGALPIHVNDPRVETIYTGLDTPHGLALDVPARKVYWADTGSNPGLGAGDSAISRGDMDGAAPLEVLAAGSEPWDVDIDRRCGSYSEWVRRCFRKNASAAQTDPAADPDKDGIPCLVEYALDTPPLDPSGARRPEASIWLDPESGKTYPALTFIQRTGTTDLAVTPQVAAGDMATWQQGSAALVEVAAANIPDNLQSVTVRSATSLEDEPLQFLRLEVSLGG